jgi:hypothetical protein
MGVLIACNSATGSDGPDLSVGVVVWLHSAILDGADLALQGLHLGTQLDGLIGKVIDDVMGINRAGGV